MSHLFDLLDTDRVRTMGIRAIAGAHAAGVRAYYGEPEVEGIVRHDADGRRFVVEVTDGDDRIVSEIDWQQPYHEREGLRTAAERD
jgi:hypothetical protein